jgi:hypothetical protein
MGFVERRDFELSSDADVYAANDFSPALYNNTPNYIYYNYIQKKNK